MTKQNKLSFQFEKGEFICEATVWYNEPTSKWIADNDYDYLNVGYVIEDMCVYQDEYAVDEHDVTDTDVIRHYEMLIETSTTCYDCDPDVDDEFDWDEENYG